MKKHAAILLLVVLTFASVVAAQPVATVRQAAQPLSFVGYVPNEFVLKFKANTGPLTLRPTPQGTVAAGVPDFDALANTYRVSDFRRQYPEAQAGSMSRYFVVTYNGAAKVEEVVAAYRNNPMVEKAEPIGIHAVYATPNDTWFPYQWHLDQSSDHDIDAQAAWDYQTGQPNIIVALMDTGVRYYHKDLGGSDASSTNVTAANGNMWINWAEKNGQPGVDDDHNGYVDDWIGWDFVTGTTECWPGEDCTAPDNDPRDFNGHGTHCAGNVAAMNNNGYGVCSAAGGWGNGTNTPNGTGVKIMALRVGYSAPYQLQEAGYVRMDFVASALYYAARNGARIASCSWGSSNTGGVAEAIDTFVARGGLIFKAAGNDNTQTADYLDSRSDVISVAATDQNDCKASFSTYGTWVGISAPGVGIISDYHDHNNPDNDYVASLDGTSMSTPIVASVAAAIWSRHPTWTAAQVKARLLSTADPIDTMACNATYAGKLGTGRVNAYNALNDGPPCDAIAKFGAAITTACTGQTVQFIDSSTGPVATWNWSFGDGQTSTAQNPSHVYANAGSYGVTLKVTSATCTNTAIKPNYLAVKTLPTAGFAGTPVSGYAPLTVTFTDQSIGATGWAWNFGDGGSQNAQSPSHAYATPGTYTVTLTASNMCGTNVATKPGYVVVTQAPALQCDDFNDGSASNWTDLTGVWSATGKYLRGNSSTSGAHLLAPFGNYSVGTIDCDVRMNAGRRNRIARLIFSYVDDKNYRFVEGDDSMNYWRLTERVAGVNTVRGSWPAAIASAVWYHVQVKILADSTVSFNVGGAPVGTYKFASAPAGKLGCGYDASVADFDNFCVASALSGNTPPTAAFVGSTLTGFAPLTVTFTDQSTGATGWSWSFGDGGSSNVQNPAHTYTAPGTYTVALTASNIYGTNVTTKTGYVVVTQAPALQCDNFNDGTVTDWTDLTGVWSATGQYLRGNSSTTDAHLLAPFGNYSVGTIDCDVRMSAGRRFRIARLIFSYLDDKNYRFVEGDDSLNYWRIVERVAGTNTQRGVWPAAITSATWYHVQVKIFADGSVSFSVAGTPIGSYKFASAPAGKLGCGYSGSVSDFDNYCVASTVSAASTTTRPTTSSALEQNRPNPFNPSTMIAFTLSTATRVRLDIYNLLGERVVTLLNCELVAGRHEARWDASAMASGVYFYRLTHDGQIETKKMLLLK